MQYVIPCDWLLSLRIFLRFIHVIAYSSTSLLFMTESYSIGWIYHILFVHLLVDKHLGGLHLLAIMSSVVMNIYV